MNFETLDKLRDDNNGATLLGVGPMSKNCVDATIELANTLKIPILLIASRRQIECKALGGGYVNNWTTEEYAQYVREHDKGGYILLARDHGGPWQGADEMDLPHAEAMERAIVSYAADISSGFDMIHLDPSLKARSLNEIKDDIDHLFHICEGLARGRSLIYEAGTEEHNGRVSTTEDFDSFVRFCKGIADTKIRFIVGLTGTHVKETRNIGTFNPSQSQALARTCSLYGMYLKEHNTDYLPTSVLEQHPGLGIQSANVAPEFGVAETQELLNILDKRPEWKKFRKRFITAAVESGKWKKWVISDNLTDEQKAVICGHYIFAQPEIQNIYNVVNSETYLDDALKASVKFSICRYLRAFGWNC